LDDPDPKAVKPRGVVGRDGAFSLTCYRADDGAPAGNYTVTILWQQARFRGGDPPPIDMKRMQEWKEKKGPDWKGKDRKAWAAARPRQGVPAVRPDPVPARYRNPQTSDLRVEVTAGPNELAPFNLTK
jgi:hypothetical protein